MESQVALGLEGPFPSNDLLTKDGDSDIASATPNIVDQQPVKKQTRQWAAWTRQEEESFFNALRQVGKNFEKITCRVQSKNKDQVRHYYYRLVRRMNKLLGPGFSLDAKNSKDTNAAMLRWWSLLEKYSCKASKLHLKPRRFKIFIEALEHQLLKDRKKNIRKRPSQAENCSSASSTNLSLHGKVSGHDSRSVKVVIVDSQSIQKVGSGKGSSMKRNVSTGCRGSSKTDLSTVKVVKQRRKTGGASSAAYKRWERAAMAGVSLVADAAEHLERATTINEKIAPAAGISNEFCSMEFAPTNGQEAMDCYNQCTSSDHQVMESSLQPSLKLKLQLFPIDETTRKALEKDEHNPHLELTLSARKKISSVLEHLNRKWGNSSIASGELILFPYSVQRENLADHQRWRQDTAASAADVYATIGSPHVFRLRYGWFSNVELASVSSRAPSTSLHVQEESVRLNIWNRREEKVDAAQIPAQPTGRFVDQLTASSKDQLTSVTDSTDLTSYTALPGDITEYIRVDPENDLPEPLENVTDTSWPRNGNGGIINKRPWEDVDNLRTSSGVQLSAGDWADSLTNMSVGELLTEASQATNGIEPSIVGSSQFLQQMPFSCDSFDAAIAAHISAHQEKVDLPSEVRHASSIWDAEETCDAFSFQKITASVPAVPGPSRGAASEICRPISSSKGFTGVVEELPEKQTRDVDPVQEEEQPMDDDEHTSKTDDSPKELGGLTDLYWPDSLGPLDLDMPSSRYHGQDFMFGDSISLSGLNRLIANSLDAFQNCSFFGLDKKEPSSTSEARLAGPFVDHKIGGEV